MTLTPEQHEIRSKGIGGSEIAAVCGLNPWMTPLDVCLRKWGRAAPQEDNFNLQRGNYLEPALISWYEGITGARVLREQKTRVHPDHPIVRATPDGIAELDGDPLVLEIKSPNFRTADHWGDAGTDEIPEYYVPQVTWEMAVTGLERADVAALLGGELKIFTVPWDGELFEDLLDIAQNFWSDHVLAHEPPPIDGSESARAWLKERYPRAIRDMVESDIHAASLMRDLHTVREDLKNSEGMKNQLENELKEIIGDHEGILSAAGRIYYRNNKDSKKTAWKALAMDFQPTAGQIAQFTKTVPGPRVFRCYFKKEK